ncbi:unnamed protein product [Owenia fusiformis]|uniref:Uncharacterized protein n=1 Tax=Owenia fusiformis TaxID=6347 RepID=A0A8J1TUK1_OWEFU|nr:unnamed protein product [Owenia fusiformis]
MVTSNMESLANNTTECLKIVFNGSISNTDTTNDMEDSTEYKLTIALWTYLSPIVLLVGLIGNLLSILVLRCTSMKRAASSVYLTALAVSDLTLLLISLSNDWVAYMFDFDIQTVHTWSCKIHTFLVYMFTDISAWMLVCVSLERVTMVYWPIRVKTIFSPCRIMVSIITMVALLCVVNIQWLFTLVVRETIPGEMMSLVHESLQIEDAQTEEEIVCIYKEGTENFRSYYWPWIDACIASFIPFTILIICNALIVAKLSKSKKFRKESTNERRGKNNNATRSITIMLIVTSFMFLILTAPFVIYLIIWQKDTKNGYASMTELIHSELMTSIFDMFIYCNSAINFILYCLSGKMFREALAELFCGKQPTQASQRTSRHSNTSVLHTGTSPKARYCTDIRTAIYNTTAAKCDNTALKYVTTTARCDTIADRHENGAAKCNATDARCDISAVRSDATSATCQIDGAYINNSDKYSMAVLGETLCIETLEITKL